MIPATLGGRVRISGAETVGRWQSWDSKTDAARVIDDDGVIHQTTYAKLRGEPVIMFNVTESVIRKGDALLPINIGRVTETQVKGQVVIALMPDGTHKCLPASEWARSEQDSPVAVETVAGRTQLVTPWLGGQPVADVRTTEEKNMREFDRVANLRADGESVTQDADPDDDAPMSDEAFAAYMDEPLTEAERETMYKLLEDVPSASTPDRDPLQEAEDNWQVQMSEILGEDPFAPRADGSWEGDDHPAAADEMVDLPAETELPPGEPEPVGTVERIMTADANAPLPPSPSGTPRSGEGSGVRASDDLANILDMLRKRIANLEDNLEDALALIAATAQRPADAPRTVETMTLWQDDLQDPVQRDNADSELARQRNRGWTVAHESTVIHPQNYTVTRIVRLERAAPQPDHGARATAAADQPNGARMSSSYVQSPLDDVMVIMHPAPEHEIPVHVGARSKRIVVGPERSAEGLRETLHRLDAEVIQSAERAVERYRASNPPPTFTPFTSALPAGQ